ncbi:DUF2633 family protein [Rosenbergiella australiborealis]|uniref:DUF2633 family protein n=1 Tax=Rosenbergiella australiborealis TaxID=1544696 RepID=A0ABS5T5L7_9GAMM|nr:DUF2633 family protein [Rosenbergiella australiborealis]MBT0727639.1 DUF2633 family protein [Rosenbergiella australiborealis]
MNNSPLRRQKKKTARLIRVVFWLSLLLLLARLIWVLPAAFEHHKAKKMAAQVENMSVGKHSAPSSAESAPNHQQ